MTKKCKNCTTIFSKPPSQSGYFCSRKCYGKWLKSSGALKMEKHPRWSGGRSSSGKTKYIRVNLGNKKWAYEHRLVAEKMVGRKLKKGEIVHHKDENKQNNSPNNLEVLNESQHRFIHKNNFRGGKIKLTCRQCKKVTEKYPSQKTIFCSKACYHLFQQL